MSNTATQTESMAPVIVPSREDGHTNVFGDIAISATIIIVVVMLFGPVHYLLTKWLVGHGWACFGIWFFCMAVTSPERVIHRGGLRSSLHMTVAILGWAWFALAMYPSQLLARNDILWAAYLASAVGVLSWRLLLHEGLLRYLIRGSIAECPACPELVAFSLGLQPSGAVPADRFCCMLLYRLAAIRALPPYGRFHRMLYGNTGLSRIATEEVQRATDMRLRDLHLALERGQDVIIISAATAAGEAFLCEAQVLAGTWLQAGNNSEQVRNTYRMILRRRTLLVLEPMLLAWIASEGTCRSISILDRAIAEWSQSIPILHRSISTVGLNSFLGAEGELAANISRPRPSDAYDAFLVDVTTAASSIRHGYFRLANSILGRAVQESQGDGSAFADAFFPEQAGRIAHSLGAVASELAQLHSQVNTGSPQQPIAALVQQSRTDHMEYHANAGQHRRLANAVMPEDSFSLSRAGVNPLPSRPREVGKGIATAIAAVAVLSAVLVIVRQRPLTSRMQPFYEVPFRQELNAKKVRASAVIDAKSTVLLASDEGGVRSVNLRSFRISSESGPPPSGPNGRVKHFAVNNQGTALALVEQGEHAGIGIDLRSADGRWHTMISADGDPINGRDLATLLPGLDRPILILNSGNRRLAEYHDADRTIRYSATKGPSIIGNVTDVCSAITTRRGPVAVIATDSPGGVAYLVRTTLNGALDVTALPAVGGNRSAKSVALGDDQTLVLVCDDGSAWELDSDSREQHWAQIRAGSQGVTLDKVRFAGIARSRRQLWLVRDDGIWMRVMGESAPAQNQGWLHCDIPTSMVPVLPGRTVFSDLTNEDAVLIITPASELNHNLGSATVIHVRPGNRLQPTDILSPGFSILDADSIGGRVIVLQSNTGSTAGRPRSKRLIEYGASGKVSSEFMIITSTFISDKDSQSLEITGKISAVGSSDSGEITIFSDGRYIRFDGGTESLRFASNENSAIIGRIEVPGKIIDGAIYTNNGQTSAVLLQDNGAVDVAVLGKTDAVKVARLIDAGGNPPASALASAAGVISDEYGFLLTNRQSLWRFDTRNAGALWHHRPTEYDNEGNMLFGFDSAGRPIIAGTVSHANILRAFRSDGTFTDWPAPSIKKLWPGVGVTAFALLGDGSLQSFDSARNPIAHMQSSLAGPSMVQDATIRPTHIDFQGDGMLHSFSRLTGQWAASANFGDGYKLYQSGSKLQPVLLLLKDNGGVPLYVPSLQGADLLRPLGVLALSKAIPIPTGVFGKTEGNGLAFVGLEGQNRIIVSTVNRQIQAEDISEVALQGDSIWALSKEGKMLRYSPADRTTQLSAITRVEAMKATDSTVFAKSGNILYAIDPSTMRQDGIWRSSDNKITAIGRPEGNSIPAVLNDGSLYLVTGASAAPMLAGRPRDQNIGVIEHAAAIGDELFVFTTDAAFRRRASGMAPFVKMSKINVSPKRLMFSPINSELWLESDNGWMRERDGMRVGRSLGWLQNQDLISTDGDGGLLTGDSRFWPDNFRPAPKNLGDPREFYSLKNGRILMLGSTDAALFDPTTRNFEPLDGYGLNAFGDGTTAHILSDTLYLRNSAGMVFSLPDNRTKTLQFGGASVSSFAGGKSGVYALQGALVIDSIGAILQHQMSTNGRDIIKVKQARKYNDAILRLTDTGSLDLFDPRTARHQKLYENISDIGIAGTEPIFRRTARNEVIDQTGKILGKARLSWFVGDNYSVIADPDDGLWVLDAEGKHRMGYEPMVMPGVMLGSMMGSTNVICRIGQASYRILDLQTGMPASKQPRDGEFIGASAQGFYFTNSKSTNAWRFDPATGEETASAEYRVIHPLWTSEGVQLYGFISDPAFCSVQALDHVILRPTGNVLSKSRLCEGLIGAGVNSQPILARINDAVQLIIGEKTIIMDDKSKTNFCKPFANPFGTPELKVFIGDGKVHLQDKDGRVAIIIASKAGSVSTQLDTSKISGTESEKKAGDMPFEVIDTRQAPKQVLLSVGTLDLASGWILEQRVDDVRKLDANLEWRDGLGKWHALSLPKNAPLWGLGKLASPFVQEQGGRVSIVRGESSMKIGQLQPGEVLPHFQIKACAAIGRYDVLIADVFGQVWHYSSRSGVSARNQIQMPAPISGFFVDKNTRNLVATGNHIAAVVSWENGRIKTKIVPLEKDNTLPDFSYAGDSVSPNLSWSWNHGETQFQYSIDKTAVAVIHATEAGFDCFRIQGLALRRGEVCGRIDAGGMIVYVPIDSAGINWASASALGNDQIESQKVTSPQRLILSDGTALERGSDLQVRAVIGGKKFGFTGGRFGCDASMLATAMGQDLITLSGNGETLIRRKLNKGTLISSSTEIFAGPDQSKIIGLSPGDKDGTLVARSSTGSFIYENGKWSRFDTPSFIRSPSSKWEWLGNRRFALAGVEYEAGLAGFPCDFISWDAERQSTTPVALPGGEVIYMGTDGRWYSVRAGTMPKPTIAPITEYEQIKSGQIIVDRRPQPGFGAPRFRMNLENGAYDGFFRIRDGVLQDTDDWGVIGLIAMADGKSVIVPCKAAGLERVASISESGLQLSAPRRSLQSEIAPLCQLIHRDNAYEITLDHRCLKLAGNDGLPIDLGRPTRDGFDALNPSNILPIGVTSHAELMWVFDGKLFRQDAMGRPDSLHMLGEAPVATNSVWCNIGGKPQLMLIGAGAFYDPILGVFTTSSQSIAQRSSFSASGKVKPFEVALVGQGSATALTAKRDGELGKSIELNFQIQPDVSTGFWHSGATSVIADELSITTWTGAWIARYHRNASGITELVSVERNNLTTAAKLTNPIALHGGLRAVRTLDGYILESIRQSRQEPWNLGSLLGPERIFLADNLIMEAASSWCRIRDAKGVQAWHSGIPFTDLDQAYRSGTEIYAASSAWKIDDAEGFRRDGVALRAPARGMMSSDELMPWGINLPESGSSCKISFRKNDIGCSDGALHADYALSTANISGSVTLLDRGGAASLSSNEAQIWAQHQEPVRPLLIAAKPSASLVSEQDGGHTRHIITSTSLGHESILNFPDSRGGQVAPSGTSAKQLIRSWTSGLGMSITIGQSGEIGLSRTYGPNNSKKFTYSTVNKEELLVSGRLLFDQPKQVLRFYGRNKGSDYICIRTSAGYEIIEDTATGIKTALITDSIADEERSSAFSSVQKEWLPVGLGDVAESTEAKMQFLTNLAAKKVGKPVIWSCAGERIFVLGDTGSVWLEMAPRWKDKPWQD